MDSWQVLFDGSIHMRPAYYAARALFSEDSFTDYLEDDISKLLDIRILNLPRLNIPEVVMPMRCAPRDRSAKGRAIAKKTLALAPTIKGKIKTQKRKRTPSVGEEYDSESKKSSARPSPPAPRTCGHPHKEGMLFLCYSLFIINSSFS